MKQIVSVIFLISSINSFSQIVKPGSEQDRKFITLDEAAVYCKCLSNNKPNEVGIKDELINDFVKEIIDIKTVAADRRLSKEIEKSDIIQKKIIKPTCKLTSKFKYLKKRKEGINCKKVQIAKMKINDIKQWSNEPLCSAKSTTAGLTTSSSSGQNIIGLDHGVKGVQGSGQLFENNGIGVVEFRHIKASTNYLDDLFSSVHNQPSLMRYKDSASPLYTQDGLMTLASVFDKYASVKSTRNWQNLSSEQFSYGSRSYKICDDVDGAYDPISIGIAYCELKDLNGVLFRDQTESQADAAAARGPNSDCIDL